MPTGIVQPKYKVVYSYPVEIQELWEGFNNNDGFEDINPAYKVPNELTVTINVSFVESMK